MSYGLMLVWVLLLFGASPSWLGVRFCLLELGFPGLPVWMYVLVI